MLPSSSMCDRAEVVQTSSWTILAMSSPGLKVCVIVSIFAVASKRLNVSLTLLPVMLSTLTLNAPSYDLALFHHEHVAGERLPVQPRDALVDERGGVHRAAGSAHGGRVLPRTLEVLVAGRRSGRCGWRPPRFGIRSAAAAARPRRRRTRPEASSRRQR